MIADARAEKGLVTPGGEDRRMSLPTSSPRPDALFLAYDRHADSCPACGRGHHRVCPEGTAIRERWLRALEFSQ